MLDLSENLIIAKNALHTTFPWLLLAELRVNDADDTVLRFVQNYEDLVFLSEKYHDTGCVAHWTLDDNAANTTVTDSGPNGYNGTLCGGDNTEDKHITGQIDGGFDFNGTDDYVNLGNILNMGTDQDFSISIWFCTSHDGSGNENMLINKRGTGSGISEGYMMWIPYGSVILRIADGSANVTVIAGSGYNDGAWHHAVGVVQRGTELRIYVDGVSINSGAETTIGDIDSTVNLGIAAMTTGYHHFDGKLDDIQIYAKALTAAEVARLYAGGRGTAKMPATFTGFNFDLDQIVYKGGEMPSTALRISHVTQFLKSTLEANRGCTASEIVLMVVHAGNLDEDPALTLSFDVLYPRITAQYVELKLGGPSPLRRRVPPDRYFADACRFIFESARCGYTRKTIADVTLSGSDPVSVEVTGHGFVTGDSIRLAAVGGITPALAGTYTITRTDANNFTLDDTDSSEYSGSYTSGGSAGYASCDRTRSDCRDRENETRFGGFPGLRPETIRLT